MWVEAQRWMAGMVALMCSCTSPPRSATESRSTPSEVPPGAASTPTTSSNPAVSDATLPTATRTPATSNLSSPEPRPGQADLDAHNDHEVGPPAKIDDCEARLKAAGVIFTPATLPLHAGPRGIPICGAHDAVAFQVGPTGVRYRPAAVVTCRLALALIDLEHLAQELARHELGSGLRDLHQGGTYNCRKMVRFQLVSEHSFGNAIDVRSFTLVDGRNISVAKHFGKLDAGASTDRARFLRRLGELAFDRALVSVSLGPYWDALHRDHFHFDLARYRVDGSRPSPGL